jgi:DNA-binding CsgD family transcriptional regulator
VVEETLSFVGRPSGKGSLPRSRSAPRPERPSLGWPSLTDAECPVVVLAAQGLSNNEIAQRLYLSRYTVETHLEHIFSKLGVKSREELGAIVAEAEN